MSVTYDNKTQPPITITFKQKSWPSSGGNLDEVSGEANPVITKIVKKTDFILGKDLDPNNDKYKDTYQMFGIAPYVNQPITIRLKDRNGNIVETKNEFLNTARMQIRKNCINLTDETIRQEESFNIQTGRLEATLKTRWGSEVCSGNNKVTLEDEFWIDSFMKHQTLCFGGDCKLEGGFGSNYGRASSKKRLKDHTEKLKDFGVGIETIIKVTGENSYTSELHGYTHKRDEKYIRFISTNESKSLPNKRIWILLHGWNGAFTDQKTMASHINDSNNASYILDWREVSHNGGWYDAGVCRASTWTRPTAIKIAEQLRKNGYTNQELVIVGHSLGTTLGREISEQLNGNARLITLDPSNETQCNNSWGAPGSGLKYNVQNNTPRKDLNQNTQFVRTFHGKGSITGSKDYSLSAIDQNNRSKNDSFRMDYQYTEEAFSGIHAATKDTFIRLIGTQKLQEQIFDKTDISGWNWKIDCDIWGVPGIQKCYDGFKGNLMIRNKGIEELKYRDPITQQEKYKYPI